MENIDIKQFIKETLINKHETATTDEYGQINKSNFSINNLFKERSNEVIEYIKTDKTIINTATYGGRHGTYTAMYDIIDKGIKKACEEALHRNENRKKNLNKW